MPKVKAEAEKKEKVMVAFAQCEGCGARKSVSMKDEKDWGPMMEVGGWAQSHGMVCRRRR